jgi:HrpA-like RNA helicase
VCTQPRAFAASSIAQRVASEFDGTGVRVGASVGSKTGGGVDITGNSICFMTDAMLIKEVATDPLLRHIAVLLIDEAHERSVHTDIVLGIAKSLLTKRQDFHVAVTSATIDPQPFIDFFAPALPGSEGDKHMEVGGRKFEVSVDYRDIPESQSAAVDLKSFTSNTLLPAVSDALASCETGHVLVFLPGQSEIEMALRCCELPDNVVPLPLYGQLSPAEQQRIIDFDSNEAPSDKRMVVFSTNVAETSLTIAGVKVVVDSGFAKEARFDQARRMTVIELCRISRSSADQRKGRAGRIEAGHCIRLYRQDELTRQNIEPEILRKPLHEIVLQLYQSKLDPLRFDYIQPPVKNDLDASVSLLASLGCIEPAGASSYKITDRGRICSELPFEPSLCGFILDMKDKFGYLREALQICAILTAPGSVMYFGDKASRKDNQAKLAGK